MSALIGDYVAVRSEAGSLSEPTRVLAYSPTLGYKLRTPMGTKWIADRSVVQIPRLELVRLTSEAYATAVRGPEVAA